MVVKPETYFGFLGSVYYNIQTPRKHKNLVQILYYVMCKICDKVKEQTFFWMPVKFQDSVK